MLIFFDREGIYECVLNRFSTIVDTLRPTTADEIERLLRQTPAKSCELEPIPTTLLKECSTTFAPIIASIFNLSIDKATVPVSLKIAHIHPLLKKPSFDPEVPNNYRLVQIFHTCLR